MFTSSALLYSSPSESLVTLRFLFASSLFCHASASYSDYLFGIFNVY